MASSIKKSHKAAIIAALLGACACVGSEKSGYATFEHEAWLYTDTVSLLPTDSCAKPAPTDIAIALRHSNGYAYSNLWVELTYFKPEAYAPTRDTFNIVLADDLGRWQGTGIGVDFQLVDTVMRGAVTDAARPITLRHIMRTDSLPGIQQAAIIACPKLDI